MTDHAKEQTKERGITQNMLETALRSGGTEIFKNGMIHYKCVRPPITCIVDPETKALVTAYWSEKRYKEVQPKRIIGEGACERKKIRMRQLLVEAGCKLEDVQKMGRKALEKKCRYFKCPL